MKLYPIQCIRKCSYSNPPNPPPIIGTMGLTSMIPQHSPSEALWVSVWSASLKGELKKGLQTSALLWVLIYWSNSYKTSPVGKETKIDQFQVIYIL